MNQARRQRKNRRKLKGRKRQYELLKVTARLKGVPTVQINSLDWVSSSGYVSRTNALNQLIQYADLYQAIRNAP